MKPAAFEYRDPRSLEEAVRLMGEHAADAMVLAGGQSLVPMLNMRLARPGMLIDLRRVRDLDYVRERDGGLAIGAMTPKRTVERSALVRSQQPLLHAATLCIAHPQIRNRGTVGGSLAQADPAAEYPAVALVLGAELRARSQAGERKLKAEDFFVTYLTTALQPGEILTEVFFPGRPSGGGWSFQEIARRHGDFAIVGVAVTLELDRKGRCKQVRIVLFGVGATPLRARGAEEVLAGQPAGGEVLNAAAASAARDLDEPLSDVHASAEYRRQLVRVLVARSLREAADRAGSASG